MNDFHANNEIRIAAVHRGIKQLSVREPIDGLKGLMRTVLWY